MSDQRETGDGEPPAANSPGQIPPLVHFAVEPLRHVRLITDAGRAIGLWRYEVLALPRGAHGDWIVDYGGHSAVLEYFDQDFRQNCNRDVSAAIRIYDPTTACNCHGWIFTSGQFGISDSDVPAILTDNGYHAVNAPLDGDLAVYWTDDHPAHSGIVRIPLSKEVRLIESKWGPFGVYLHSPTVHPFRGDCRFYRTTRSGHANIIVSTG